MTEEKIRSQLIEYLKKGNAHVSVAEAASGIPEADRCREVENLPYTLWELLEHIRIVQWDIVEFCHDPEHDSPEFPEGYWPDDRNSVSDSEWQESVDQIRDDRDRLIELIRDPDRDLTEPFPWGDGQTLQKEAQVVIDHRSYHTGQIIVLRRLLGNWTPGTSGFTVEG